METFTLNKTIVAERGLIEAELWLLMAEILVLRAPRIDEIIMMMMTMMMMIILQSLIAMTVKGAVHRAIADTIIPCRGTARFTVSVAGR